MKDKIALLEVRVSHVLNLEVGGRVYRLVFDGITGIVVFS